MTKLKLNKIIFQTRTNKTTPPLRSNKSLTKIPLSRPDHKIMLRSWNKKISISKLRIKILLKVNSQKKFKMKSPPMNKRKTNFKTVLCQLFSQFKKKTTQCKLILKFIKKIPALLQNKRLENLLLKETLTPIKLKSCLMRQI